VVLDNVYPLAVGEGFNLCSIHKVMLQRDIFLFGEKLEDSGKNGLQNGPHPLRAKPINGAEIRSLSTCNPHEHEILTNRFGDLTGGINSLRVGVDNDFR
jgi:hypothetical protein